MLKMQVTMKLSMAFNWLDAAAGALALQINYIKRLICYRDSLDIIEHIDDNQEENDKEWHPPRHNLLKIVLLWLKTYFPRFTFGSIMKLIQDTVTNNMQGI